jgi:hypothetical protein
MVAMFTMEHKQSKHTAEQGSLNNSEHQYSTFKMTEAMGLKIIASRSP